MWQLVFMINGCFISLFGCAMLIVGFYDIYATSSHWSPFMISALICLFIGISLFLSNRGEFANITMKQGYLLTTIGWFMFAIFSALPFVLYSSVDNFHDAFFESMSGITATGATIFTDIESLPKAILLWRSVLNGMGGIGVVIFAVALLPFLGIGGMQIFKRENSDISDKFMPKFHYIAKRILIVYSFFLLACAISLYFGGMNWFDAINHSMATVATAGFSTKNASIGYYDSAKIEAIIIFFMLVCSFPMTFYIMLMQGKYMHSFKTEQIITFLKVVLFYVLTVSLWLTINGNYDGFLSSLRHASFNIISIMTTTGFASTDYLLWGTFAGAVFMVFSLTGGCTGSASGSIKIFRWQVVWAYLKQSLLTATNPNQVSLYKIKQYVVSNPIVSSVLLFVFLSFFSIFALTVILAISGLDFLTSFTTVIACFSNTGPASSGPVGPVGNYAHLPAFAKYVLSIAMLLGRLEVLTVLVVFTPNFWKK